MNAKVNLSQHKISPGLWVCASLDWFAKRHLQQPSALFSASNFDQQFADLSDISLAELPQQFSQMNMSQLELPASLVRLLNANRISQQELFVACFCAELNENYWLNIALQEMQGVHADAWPRSYFLCDLLNSFCAERTTATDMLQWPLVKAGVLVINLRGPLVLSHVELNVERWQWFISSAHAHQLVQAIGVSVDQSRVETPSPIKPLPIHPLPDSEHHSAVETFALAFRLQNLSCLHLCASVYAGRAFALALAIRLNVELIVPVRDVIQFPVAFDLVCAAYDWLPMVEFSMMQEFMPAESMSTKIAMERGIILHRDHIVNDQLDFIQSQPATAVHWLASAPYVERIITWQQWFDKATAEVFANRWLCNSDSIRSLMSRVEPGITHQSNTAIEAAIKCARLQSAPASVQGLAFHVPWQLNADAIVFTPKLTNDLLALKERCLQRQTLCNGLGKSLVATHNTGVRALLYGESGTGKTLAAVFLAAQLGAPLYRLDLGAVLNKYVGETEKNLHQLLEQIADEDFILLIDEADALFAKRTDGESGGERFANMLTNYLLARIEQHPGIVLMTTNGLGRIDTAFMRRFDRVIEFQSPQVEERALIWQQHLGERNPGEGYCRQLASLCDLTGGFIRNAVLTAAAEIPASQQLLIPYAVLLKTIALEYRKSGKPVPPKLLSQLNLQLANQTLPQSVPAGSECDHKEIAQ